MAAGLTTPAGRCFLISDRQLPFPEGHAVADVLGVVRAVGIVACPAGASFDGFMYMDVMQVPVPVPEIGERRSELIVGDGILMAHEAQLVIILVIRSIEHRRKDLSEHPEVLRAVRIVATRAVALPDRPMFVRAGLQDRLHVRKLAVLAVIFAVVAAQAELHRLLAQLPGIA